MNLSFQKSSWLSLLPWLGAILSGVLQTLAFPPFEQDWLIWIALTPLIAALWFAPRWKKYELLRVFLLGGTAGIVSAFFTFSWLQTVSLLGWLLLSGYLALYPALWGVFVSLCVTPREIPHHPGDIWLGSLRNLRTAALGAIGWIALEMVRSVLFTGFGWNTLGVALYRQTAMIQVTAITGVAGLSFLIAMMNIMLVITARRITLEMQRRRLRTHYDFSLTLALVAVTFGFGFREVFRKSETFPLKVAAIQTQIAQSHRWAPNTQGEILRLLIDQAQAAAAWQPDLMIWPEAATPEPILSDQTTFKEVQKIASLFPGDLLTGTVLLSPEGDFNSAALFTNGAEQVQFQHKQHLVPFGEYVPLRGSFPLFAWVIGDQVPSDFDESPDAVILESSHKDVRIGALICFEDTLAYIVRRFALQNANLLVNVTNDGWFNESAASRQHLANAVFRCTETGIPMVRAANTGVTCFIDRLGRLTRILEDEQGSTFTRGILMGEIAIEKSPSQTFYTRYGDVVGWGLSGIAGIVFCVGIFVRKRQKK